MYRYCNTQYCAIKLQLNCANVFRNRVRRDSFASFVVNKNLKFKALKVNRYGYIYSSTARTISSDQLIREEISEDSLNEIHSAGTASDHNSSINNHSMVHRPKLRISHILTNMPKKKFTIPQNSSIAEAISHLVTEKLASSLAINELGEIVGIFTARDLLKLIHNQIIEANSRKDLYATILKDIITKKEKLVYCSPDDSVKRCREIMFQLKIRNMPILDKDRVVGIITMKDLADSAFSLSDTGGKKGFIHNVTGRKGLPTGAKVAQDIQLDPSLLPSATSSVQLYMEVGSYYLPHPFKYADGVAGNRRLYGAKELSNDLSLCEDAHLVLRAQDPIAIHRSSSGTNPSNSTQEKSNPSFPSLLPIPNEYGGSVTTDGTLSDIYMCVADGVGSWRQYGVDPREFSHRLVENARKVIESDVWHRDAIISQHATFDKRDEEPIHPLDVIIDAWNMTTSERINGSSTICVATLDKKLNQLSYSNLGDCGLVVIRHIDSETAGYMRERQLPRHLRKNDFRIAYLSQQQLKSFNLPYQLGFSNVEDMKGSFENPSDADTASIPVMPGDIVLMATDGLFDNVDLNEIVDEVGEWEVDWFTGPRSSLGDDIKYSQVQGTKAIHDLAKRLAIKARELSLDPQRDSPFAILAKENDIMWGGGMPDDTTVIVARIFTKNAQ